MNSHSPWPWTKSNNLIYYGEQVSHHPPVSAFYVECPSASIEASCWLLSKAKFRGFHVKVKNEGDLSLNLIDLNEQYVVTFPDGYGRAIFTTPWCEAGGKSSISCFKTGLMTEIEYFTKPLLGGEKNKIKAKILNKEKQELYTFEGNWDGNIFMTSSPNKPASKWFKQNKELFINVHAEPRKSQIPRHYSHLPENDSRKIWREVSWCIKNRQTEIANNFKVWIESQQRSQQQARELTAVTWHPHLFEPKVPDGWDFLDPLSKRVKKTRSSNRLQCILHGAKYRALR